MVVMFAVAMPEDADPKSIPKVLRNVEVTTTNTMACQMYIDLGFSKGNLIGE